MIVISRDYVITPTLDDITGDNPVIGYENRVTAANVAADLEADGFPVVNLANPSTALKWMGVDDYAEQHVTVLLNGPENVDYVGIARHNFGSALIPVTIEGATELDSDGFPVWFELVQETQLPDDSPAVFRFEPQSLLYVRLKLGLGLEAPEMAVLYVGQLLVLQRRIYVGHTPINMGRRAAVMTGRSETGQFLGRLITGEWRENSVALQNLTPDWYRSYMDPFVEEANRELPFFFAWRPESYPFEVGFVWLTAEAKPVNQRSNGMMQIDLQLSGVT